MKVPVGPAAALASASTRLLGATWRLRRLGGPPFSIWPACEDERGPGRLSRPPRIAERLPPACYAFWHEHQLPLALYHRDQWIVALVSRHRDGEIVARVLRRMGYGVARGSSSRGGAAGLKGMIRAAERGRPLAFTPDGPRGPARICKSGIVHAAARTGLPVVPVGMAASGGRRLRSWDRFLVPAPGARVVLSYGAPIRVPPDGTRDPDIWAQRIGDAIEQEVARCEAAAREGAEPPLERPASRERVERRLRSAWTGRPGPLLRAAGAAFGCAADVRRLAYDAGILRAWRAPLPVGSIGGLTVGGSGKTPVTAELANWLASRGHRTAILTRGFPDELALHRALAPHAVVIGDPDRYRGARRAVQAGARVALLDDGFQHRRLGRDLEIVLIDLDAVLRTNLHRLPAGPFRERFAAVARADALVITRRGADGGDALRLERWLRRRLAPIPVARLSFSPGDLVAANGAAVRAPATEPAVAVSGIMKPGLFFEQAVRRVPGLAARLSLPDHAVPGADAVEACVRAAGLRGVVCTRKDVSRLVPLLPEAIPIWYLEDRIRWESGEEELRRRVDRLGTLGASRPGGGRAAAPHDAGARCAS